MTVHVVTLFPELIEAFVSAGVMGRAREKGLLEVHTVQLRDFAGDRHHTVDDCPYGGGAGMILKAEPMARAMSHVKSRCRDAGAPVALTTPNGRLLNAGIAREYAAVPEWIIICGHYGGADQRIADAWATDEISIGDYVLTGGEAAAMVMLDAAARFVPGVLGNEDSAAGDTFEDGLLGAPLYTRPPEFEGRAAPEVLLSGHHARIEQWRRRMKLEITLRRRPDLLEKAALTDEDKEYLKELGSGEKN